MYKVIWLTNYRKDIPWEEADHHWRVVHGDLMRRVPGVERYVQNRWTHSIGAEGTSETGRAFDLHSECWFADEAAYERALQSPEWADVAADSPKCFDLQTLAAAVLDERVIVHAAGTAAPV